MNAIPVMPTELDLRRTSSCRYEQLFHMVFLLVILGALPSCATYMKCGLRGCPGDAQVTSDVRASLNQYPSLEAPTSIDVQTLDRVVYLYGIVSTDLDRQLAVSIASQVPGVSRVVDALAVNNMGG